MTISPAWSIKWVYPPRPVQTPVLRAAIYTWKKQKSRTPLPKFSGIYVMQYKIINAWSKSTTQNSRAPCWRRASTLNAGSYSSQGLNRPAPLWHRKRNRQTAAWNWLLLKSDGNLKLIVSYKPLSQIRSLSKMSWEDVAGFRSPILTVIRILLSPWIRNAYIVFGVGIAMTVISDFFKVSFNGNMQIFPTCHRPVGALRTEKILFSLFTSINWFLPGLGWIAAHWISVPRSVRSFQSRLSRLGVLCNENKVGGILLAYAVTQAKPDLLSWRIEETPKSW